MGFLDSILGKTKLPEAKTDRLFAISTSAVTLESSLGLKPDGAAGVCIKPMESSRYEAARAEIEELLQVELQRDRHRVQNPEGRVQLHLGGAEGHGLRRSGDQCPNGEPDPDGAGLRNAATGCGLPL